MFKNSKKNTTIEEKECKKKCEELETKRKSCESESENLKKKVEELEKEVEEWKKKAEKLENSFLRDHADIDNLRKSLEKDRANIYKYRLESIIDNLISNVLDGFEMAFKYGDDSDPKIKNFLIGFKALQTNLLNILYKEGLEVINPKKGDNFDEMTMKVVETVFSEKKDDNGKILEVKFKGYKLFDKLIRPAIVVALNNNKDENRNNKDKESIK